MVTVAQTCSQAAGDLTDRCVVFQQTCDGATAADYTTTTCGTAEMTEFFSAFSAAGGATTTDFGLEVFLYADTAAFDEFVAEVNADLALDTSLQTVTTLDISHAEDYSSYVMAWNCNLTTMLSGGAGQVGDGCCLRDLEEDTEGGGYCLISNSGSTQVTYRLTEENFVSFTSETTFTWDTDMEQNQDGFNNFLCDSATSDNTGFNNCRKFQFWPAASWANGFRFEKDKSVMAYVLDTAATTAATMWMDEEQVLNGAFSSFLSASAALAISAVLAY